MGVFPILEILGQASPNDITFPASYAIETELANAFRAALPPSTVQAAEFETVWAGEACPDVNGTPATLLLLKHKIKEANWALVKKRLIWAIATTMFVGSFRISEVLAAYSHTHAKDSTLLNQDISEHTENIAGDNRNFLKVRLHNLREDRN